MSMKFFLDTKQKGMYDEHMQTQHTHDGIRFCSICGKVIKDKTNVIAVVSGTLDLSSNNLSPTKESYVYHMDCFQTVAGDEYCPKE